jgi:hypothetical protein
MTALEHPNTLEVMASALRLLPSVGKFPREEKVMQIEKGTKLLKRVWKAIVYIHLVMVAAALLFLSQYFSWDVFVSNFHQQATAATASVPQR